MSRNLPRRERYTPSMRLTALVMTALLATTPACTVVGMGAGAGLTGIHNGFSDEADDWNYTAPMITGAVIGLITDFILFKTLGSMWSKPMT
jgi:hypothetical protein